MQRDLDDLARDFGDVQLATLAKEAPSAGDWSYELKWDGYRILAMKSGDRVRLLSRRHQDWTDAFRSIAEDVARIGARAVVLDGEICALDERGMPSFQRLQNRARGAELVYFVFDLLMLDGRDLRALRLDERRRRLEELLARAKTKRVMLSQAFEGDPRQILRTACDAGLEGIVAKKKSARYAAASRASTWLKIKCTERQEFAVVGWLPSDLGDSRIGSLVLALKGKDGRFHFAGKVGTGYDDATRKALATLLGRDRADGPTAAGVPRFGGKVRFVVPRYAAEVVFTEWTAGGHVRHPSFVGLRKDKTADECVREPVEGANEANVVAGVRISHPERVLSPTGLTKLDLARYYQAIGPWMLPHVRGRPLTLVRWAEGKTTEKGGVYLRHARAWGPAALRRVRIREKTKIGEYLVVDSIEALVSLAQMDILEIHTWNATADDVEHPNRVVFDLDPAPDVAFGEVIQAARHVRRVLEGEGLESFVKTTGGKGLHVVAPLACDRGWDACLELSRAIVRTLAREDPARYVLTMKKSARRGRIYVDYLRNGRANTSVAAYSTRARPGAPVSVPLAWDELDDVDPASLTPDAVLARMKRLRRDPWGRAINL